MLLTELFDLDEAAGVGVVPANKKAAKDPRYANALTVDIHPGETQKQAAKFGNNKYLLRASTKGCRWFGLILS